MPPKETSQRVAKRPHDGITPTSTTPAVSTFRRQMTEYDPMEDEQQMPGPATKKQNVKGSGRLSRNQNDATDHDDTALPPSSAPDHNTQQMNQALEKYKKQQAEPKGSFVNKFVADLELKRAEIGKLPEEKDRELEKTSADFTKAFKAQVDAALSVPLPASQKTANTKRGRQQLPPDDLWKVHPLYGPSNAWLNLSKNAISTYHQACKLVSDAKPEKTLGASWQEETDALVEILDMGKRVTRRKVEGMMERGSAMTVGRKAAEDEENRDVGALLSMELDTDMGEEGISWVESVRCAERGVRKLTDGLPLTFGEDA